MDWIKLVITTFAVYRAATDVAWEAGPLALFEKMRGRVEERFGADHWMTEGVSCPICLSFWFALPLIFRRGPLYWLGVAGAAAFLARSTKQ